MPVELDSISLIVDSSSNSESFIFPHNEFQQGTGHVWPSFLALQPINNESETNCLRGCSGRRKYHGVGDPKW